MTVDTFCEKGPDQLSLFSLNNFSWKASVYYKYHHQDNYQCYSSRYITHSNGSGAITLIIILVIIFVVYWCLSTKIVQTKQTQLARAFFTKSIYSHPQLWINKKGGIVRGRSTLRDPICCIFFLCVPFLRDSVPYQFLENRNEQSCTQFSELRTWERAPAWIPFSDSLQWPFTYRTIHFVATDGISFLMAE